MNDIRIGSRVVYQNNTYIVVGIEAGNLVVKRTGTNVCITIPSGEVTKVLEEGKDTQIDRNIKKING